MHIVLFIMVLFAGITGATAGNAQQSSFDTVTVYFDIGRFSIDKNGKRTLDSLWKEVGNTGRGVLIYGYADYLGEGVPNQSLSEQRANVVSNYLLKKGLKPALILTATGVGQRNERRGSEHGYQLNRRTDVLIRGGKPKKPTAVATVADKDIVTSRKTVSKNPDLLTNMDRLHVDETLVLKNISFYESTHRIIPASRPELDVLLDMMRKHPSLKIQIEGHVCCVTGFLDATDIETGEMDLSFQRAKFVRDYLVANGITSERLKFVGMGRRSPVYRIETTPEEAQANRRVEIRILEK